MFKQLILLVFLLPAFIRCNSDQKEESELPEDDVSVVYGKKITHTKIIMEETGGVYLVPCEVNGLPLKFIFDTGASNVTLSLTEALFMIKNGYLSKDEIYGSSYAQLANGEVTENTEILLREIKIAHFVLRNVRANIVHEMAAPLLLGQSAIRQLGKIQLDGNELIVITEKDVIQEYAVSNDSMSSVEQDPATKNKKKPSVEIEEAIANDEYSPSGIKEVVKRGKEDKTEYSYFGDRNITPNDAIMSTKLIKYMAGRDSVAMKVKGTIAEVGQKRGVWMSVEVDDGKMMHVSFNYEFFLPFDCGGKEMIMDGYAYKEVFSVQKLRQLAEDAGWSQEEINGISQPKETINFLATGVMIKN
jgi:clan AA aspartic protease (TIGR02281 family)